MQFFAGATALLALALTGVQAQDQSICDKYTVAKLMNNTAANQKTLLTLVVNSALIGNYSAAATVADMNTAPILGENSPIAKYFDGSLESTNRGGQPTKVSFLDGGAAAPLMLNMPANSTNSNQYRLLTHLYQYFGALLGCSLQTTGANANFSVYQGEGSMSKVHRFMNLTAEENNYFIAAVGGSAASFGVSTEDITKVANALNTTFNYKCLPPASVAGSAMVSQSICLAESCPEASPSNCTVGANSFPDAAAAAVSNTAGNSDASSNPAESGSPSGSGNNPAGSPSAGGGNSDGASTNMVSMAIGSTLALAGLAVATLF